MIYFQLFLSFFQIGLLSFGGGYAAMPLIQSQGTGGAGTRLAFDVGVYGSYHHLPDDTGADRSQFGNLRRN